MEKTDVKEIRKAVKAKENCIDWIYGVYVNTENEVVWEHVDSLRNQDEAEQFRHTAMFAKVLSPHFGRDSFPMKLETQQDMLLSLRTEKKELPDFRDFRDLLLSAYPHTDPYYAVLARVIYDIPVKTKDKRSLDDSEYVYEAVLCCICPSKLSVPALGLKDDRVAELERRWTIGNPKCGFLYPAFDERNEDRNEVLLYTAEPDAEAFLQALFQPADGIQPVGPKMQKELFQAFLSRLSIGVEDAAAIAEGIAEHAARDDTAEELSRQDVVAIAESAGVRLDEDTMDEAYEDTIGTTPILTDALIDKNVTVRTDSAQIRLPAARSQIVETRTIDGRDYILIPADGTIEVNGVSVSAKKILSENKETD